MKKHPQQAETTAPDKEAYPTGAAPGANESKDIEHDTAPPADADEVQAGEPQDDAVQQLRKAQMELDALQDRYLRMLAEFDNYKRRTSRERERLIESANAAMMLDLVEVRDVFERALHAGADAGGGGAVYEGVRLIFTKLEEALGKHGLRPFACEGEVFDPAQHDAMMTMPHESIAEGHIAQVLECGYLLKGGVLKHARVIVSSGAPEAKFGAPRENETAPSSSQQQDDDDA